MTNAEKFIEVMNKIYGIKFELDKLRGSCPPLGRYKECLNLYCSDCYKWWDKEYVEPEEAMKDARD